MNTHTHTQTRNNFVTMLHNYSEDNDGSTILQTMIKEYNFEENRFYNTINSLSKSFAVATAASK